MKVGAPTMLTFILTFVINILLWCIILPPAVLVCLPFYTFSRLVVLCRYGRSKTKLGGLEAGFTCEDPESRCSIHTFLVLNGRYKPDFVREYDRKIMAIVKGMPDFPFMSYPERLYNYYYWKREEDFSFSKHTAIPKGVDQDKVYSQSQVSAMFDQFNQAFQKGRSMWWIDVIPRFAFDHEVNDPEAADKYCYIIHVHHNICDGVALVKFLLKFFGDDVTDYDPIPKMKVARWKWYCLHAAAIISIPCMTVPKILRRIRNHKRLPRLNGKKILCWARPCSINLVRFIKKKAECSFSEVILSSVGASLHQHFRNRLHSSSAIRSAVALAFPPSKEGLVCNNFSLVDIPVANFDQTPLERLEGTVDSIRKVRRSIHPLAYYWRERFLGLFLPMWLLSPVSRMFDSAALVSYLPGPKMDLPYHGGDLIDSAHFTTFHRDRTGISVSIITCNQKVWAGFLVDEALVSGKEEVQRMAAAFRNNLLELGKDLDYDNIYLEDKLFQ